MQHTHARASTRPNTHTYTHTHIHTRTHTRNTHTHTHTSQHTHTHTHLNKHTHRKLTDKKGFRHWQKTKDRFTFRIETMEISLLEIAALRPSTTCQITVGLNITPETSYSTTAVYATPLAIPVRAVRTVFPVLSAHGPRTVSSAKHVTERVALTTRTESTRQWWPSMRCAPMARPAPWHRSSRRRSRASGRGG